MTFAIRLLAVALVVTLARPAHAQQPAQAPSPLKRTMLGQHTLSAQGRDGVQAFVELAVGGVAPRHTHAGEELAYIIEGTGVLEVAGLAPQPFKPGDALFIPANTPHLVRNTGTVTIKLAAVYVVETGKPLATPAP